MLRSPPERGSWEAAGRSGSWEVRRESGTAAELQTRDHWVSGGARRVWFFDCTRPAVVLGSVQPADHVDPARASGSGVEVVRRRSGGGAVLVVPGETIWVDVEVPHLDHLWEPDVGRAFNWLGCVWAGALDSLGLGPAMVHSGALLRREWSERICFVGLGPGELTVDGRKVLGISQRRSREGAVFSCAAYLRLHPGALPSLLALSDAARELATAASEASSGALGAGLAVGVRRADVEAAFLERLP